MNHRLIAHTALSRFFMGSQGVRKKVWAKGRQQTDKPGSPWSGLSNAAKKRAAFDPYRHSFLSIIEEGHA